MNKLNLGTYKCPENHWLDAINSPWYKLILQLEDLIVVETNNFFQSLQLHTLMLPITTGSISSPMGLGSDSIPVKINLNGQEIYLADSMQFLLEYGCRFFNDGCYYIMPTFRGETADNRHLNQFFHSEAEIRGSLEDVMKLIESYIKYLCQKILDNFSENIESTTHETTNHISQITTLNQFRSVTFDKAISILKTKFPHDIDTYVEIHDGWRDITPAGEIALLREFHNEPLWVTNFDAVSVPFYQKTDSNNPRVARNADLLMGIGETVGCGERNATGQDTLQELKKRKIDPSEYNWYVEMKNKYPMQTSGFGMGIERFLMFILKQPDIRNYQLVLRLKDEKIVL